MRDEKGDVFINFPFKFLIRMKLTMKIELVVKMFIENCFSLSKLYIRAKGGWLRVSKQIILRD